MRTNPFSGTDGCGTLLMCLKRVKIPEEVLPSENQVIGKYYRPSNRSEVLLTKCNFSNKNRQILTLYICFRIYFSHLFPLFTFLSQEILRYEKI